MTAMPGLAFGARRSGAVVRLMVKDMPEDVMVCHQPSSLPDDVEYLDLHGHEWHLLILLMSPFGLANVTLSRIGVISNVILWSRSPRRCANPPRVKYLQRLRSC